MVPTFSAHWLSVVDHDFNMAVDRGDYVIVTNSRMVKVTGRKKEQTVYRKHAMYPGAPKETPYKDSDMMIKQPDEVDWSQPL